MRYSLQPKKLKYQLQPAYQRSSDQFDWPQDTLEAIAGVPDILNETLADNIVAAVLKKEKQKGQNDEQTTAFIPQERKIELRGVGFYRLLRPSRSH